MWRYQAAAISRGRPETKPALYCMSWNAFCVLGGLVAGRTEADLRRDPERIEELDAFAIERPATATRSGATCWWRSEAALRGRGPPAACIDPSENEAQ
jgi:hypothetical protein